ncbi:hypothetical protein B0T24DRAFT_486930, partial [Lasiosphaeria ovina]
LWVGNLGWGVDDNVLFEEFKEFEDLLSARVVSDKETGRSRGFGYGFAYVTFSSIDEAKTVFEALNGADLDGRAVRLDYAKPRDSNGGGGGRGGGRGG